MRRNIIMLVCLILVLAVLGGGYYFAVKWEPKDKGSKELNDDKTEVSYVINEELENVESIEIANLNEKYLLKNNEIIGFKSNILSDELISSAFKSLCRIPISKSLENVENMAEYGLEPKKVYVTYKLKDNTVKTLLIGDNAYFEGEYYIAEENTKTVYTVSKEIYDLLTMSPKSLRDLNVCSYDVQSVKQILISHDNNVVFNAKMDESKTIVKDNVQMPTFVMTTPYNGMKVSFDKILALTNKMGDIYASEIVEENPSSLNLYGLDKPNKFMVTDKNGAHTLYIGNKTENGLIYIMYNDENVVYLADYPLYDDIKNAKATDYIDRFIHLYDITKVKQLDIEYGGSKTSFSIDSAKGKYKKNGKFIAENKLKDIYGSVVGITMSDFAQEQTRKKLQYKITFGFTDNTSKSYSYYEYDERYSVVKTDSGHSFLTLTKNLDTIKETIK